MSQPAIPVREFFTLDLRSLALFRMALGFMLLLDWLERLVDMRAFYSDEGILPRAAITGIQPVSLYFLNGSVWFGSVLGVLACGLAILLMVGWRTTFVTLLSWVLLISIHGRNPAVMQGGDHLMRAMLLWGIFLPLGACWSIDARRLENRPTSLSLLSIASFAYVLQICEIYWFAGAWKWLSPWREEGTAVYLALHVDHFSTRLAHVVREFPALCEVLTHATIWLETLGPLLLLLPFNVPVQRMLAIFLFVMFHAGLALTMELGHFPFLCMVAWIPLLPGLVWDRLDPGALPAWMSGVLTRVGESTRAPAWQPPSGMVSGFMILFILGYITSANVFFYLDTKLPMLNPELVRQVVPLVPTQYYQMSLAAGLEQGWGLFAPQPGRLCGWHLVVGIKENGDQIDMLRSGVPVDWDKPALLSATYPSGRWRKLLMNLHHVQTFQNLLPALTRHYLVEWNQKHGDSEQLRAVEVFWMREVTVPPGETPPPPEKVFLGRYLREQPARPGKTGLLLVAGTRADGGQIDLLRGGARIDWDSASPVQAEVTSSSAPLLSQVLNSEGMKHMLPGFARFQLEQWNRDHVTPADQVRRVEILWLPDPPREGRAAREARREVLATFEGQP